MRIALALLLATAACAGPFARGPHGDPRTAAAMGALPGIWRVTQVNGQNLPVASPSERNVTIEHASLLLAEGGDYALTISARVGAEPARDNTQRGRWHADATTLTTSPEAASPTRFTWRIASDRLTLRDQQGVAYTLTRN